MKLSNTSMLEAGDILALLREFNSEAENILAHLDALERACEEEIAARATH